MAKAAGTSAGRKKYKTGTGWAADVVDFFGVETNPIDAIRQEYPEFDDFTDSELLDILQNSYYTEDKKIGKNSLGFYDVSRAYSDYNEMLDALSDMPKQPAFQDYLDSAREETSKLYSGMYDELNALADERRASYDSEISGIAEDYRGLRSNLLSQQYQQNAQLMDQLQSGMDRNRRNALEAGASAGIRIADNINTLLTVQNKQSATAMDTANQLSQMMINQRNAEAGARNSYNDYMTQNTMNRQNLKREEDSYARSLADTNYTAANDSYATKQTEFDNKYAFNPFYKYKGQMSQYGGNN